LFSQVFCKINNAGFIPYGKKSPLHEYTLARPDKKGIPELFEKTARYTAIYKMRKIFRDIEFRECRGGSMAPDAVSVKMISFRRGKKLTPY
jgi:hypothetical protein